MRILQVINSLSAGGAEKILVDSIPGYEAKGIKVDVLLLKKEDGFFYNKMREAINGEIFELTQGSIYNPLLIVKIASFLKRYDVIHAHLFPVLYWVVLAKKISRIKTPIVYTEHSSSNRRRNHFLLKYADKIIYRGLDYVGCVSEDVYRELSLFLGYEKRLSIINNAINLNDFNQPIEHDLKLFPKSNFVLIQVSRFNKMKDHKTLIKSLQYLPDRVSLLLVGDGPLRSESEILVNDLSLQKRVKFLGNRLDIPQLLAYADICVLSSYHEGLSLFSIEGMASKKPVLASNVKGIREVVGGYGVLFEQGDIKELAKEITLLFQDKNYYNRVATKCYKRSKDFSMKKMTDDYINLYKKLMKD